MADDLEILRLLRRHRVPFVVIGGHAVNFHGYLRITEDSDVVWLRSPESEQSLLRALTELNAQYIGSEIDPATSLERSYPVTISYIQGAHLMMLSTKMGFLDLFDYVPGAQAEEVEKLLATSIESDGLRFASLDWLRRMKQSTDRAKDKNDLENLPD